MDRFQPAGTRRQPKPRYTSLPLLNSIVINDLDNIQSVGYLTSVLSGTKYDTVFTETQNPSNAIWTSDISFLHHWKVLHKSVASVKNGTIQQRLDNCAKVISLAKTSYNTLMGSGVLFDSNSGNRHLEQWETALTSFRTRVGV